MSHLIRYLAHARRFYSTATDQQSPSGNAHLFICTDGESVFIWTVESYNPNKCVLDEYSELKTTFQILFWLNQTIEFRPELSITIYPFVLGGDHNYIGGNHFY